ncbi:hypothetical protein BD779DRAFT_603597 [Infundibulicybe gibba]|nr:hypothetical protein BD779DRAFT_603597 [Infundibulicybe gibba]
MRSFLHSFRFRGKFATDPEASPIQQFKPLENTPPLNDNRWSDVVPPKSALVFAVVWGPDDEIVTFSEADLFDLGEGDLNVAPCYPASDARDDRSQMLTLGHSSVLLSAHPSTLAFFRDKHEHLFSQQTDRAVFGGARTSSTLGGLDVYLRGSMLGKTFPIYKRYSCLEDMDTEVHFETQNLFAEVSPRGWHGQDDGMTSFNDEGYYEGVPTHNAIQGEVILVSFNSFLLYGSLHIPPRALRFQPLPPPPPIIYLSTQTMPSRPFGQHSTPQPLPDSPIHTSKTSDS